MTLEEVRQETPRVTCLNESISRGCQGVGGRFCPQLRLERISAGDRRKNGSALSARGVCGVTGETLYFGINFADPPAPNRHHKKRKK